MSAPVTEQAAALTVEATSRALRLPTVREQAGSLAEAALRDRLSHLAYLAELLQAELDDRDARPPRAPRPRGALPEAQAPRRLRPQGGAHRRPGAARLPRELRVGRTGGACRAARRQRDRQVAPADRPRHGRLSARAARALHHGGTARERARRGRRRAHALARGRPLRPARPCSASTSSATCSSTGAAPSCSSRSSPSARSGRRWRSPPTPRSRSGAETFADPRLAAAVVDRITFRAHIIETGSESYRLLRHEGRCSCDLITTAGWGQNSSSRWGQMELSFPFGNATLIWPHLEPF